MKHLPRRTPLLDKRLADALEDAREVSRRIVKLNWIIVVLLPLALGILFVILEL
jgi:hypothetical protein